MGFTHYFYKKETLDKKKFKDFAKDVKKLYKASKQIEGVFLADGRGTVGTTPIATDELICFNGMAFPNNDTSYETLYIERAFGEGFKQTNDKGLVFGFCKTQYRPYDTIVIAVLVALKKHFPSSEISSDGDKNDWEKGVAFAQEVLGYGGNYDIDNDEFKVVAQPPKKKRVKKTYKVKDAVEKLVENECKKIQEDIEIHYNTEKLKDLIKNGCTGFAEMTKEDLKIEFEEAFGIKIKIK